jgi:hypothetical protein
MIRVSTIKGQRPADGFFICGATLYLAPEANVPARYCSVQWRLVSGDSPTIR